MKSQRYARVAATPRQNPANAVTADLSKHSALCLDHGYFIELAFRLAREGGFGKVYYCKPWEDALSKIDGAVIGDGFSEIERVSEPWGLIDAGKVDCVVFPDVHHAEMQAHIESLQVPVWGSRAADRLELHKIAFKKLQAKLGMNYPEYDVITGLDDLRQYCRDFKDRWIKISPQYRGNRETFHHDDYESSRETLDGMGVEFGILQNLIKFVCEHPLDSEIEGGLDTYIIDGKHPAYAVSGFEKKDYSYFASVLKWEDIPEEIRGPTEMLLPTLAECRYRNFHSSEVKILDGKPYELEPTCRYPSPAGEEQMELYANLPEIVFEGAQGRLVEPELNGRFACEAMIEHCGDEEHPRSMRVPDEVRQWVKLYNIAQVVDRLWIAPGCNIIGAVVGIGDTPQEALDHLKDNASALKKEPVKVHVESLASILEEIEKAESEGLHFSDKPLPQPAEAVEGAA